MENFFFGPKLKVLFLKCLKMMWFDYIGLSVGLGRKNKNASQVFVCGLSHSAVLGTFLLHELPAGEIQEPPVQGVQDGTW